MSRRGGSREVVWLLLLLMVLAAGCSYFSKTNKLPDNRTSTSKGRDSSFLTVDITPGYGQRNQSRSQGTVITFSENIANPSLAGALFSVEPPLSGALEWPAPNELKFTPLDRWPVKAEVTVNLKGGPDGLRGTSGHYLESDFQSFFTVVGEKAIDVDLSTQTLTLLQDEKPLFSSKISSGKPGYDTPTGQFEVYAKDRVIDMASTPEAVEFYYAPDVPFVLWFHGSYSIHGTYWHNAFGRVRSHGCVNAPVDVAEYIYGWAPVGTPVYIHN